MNKTRVLFLAAYVLLAACEAGTEEEAPLGVSCWDLNENLECDDLDGASGDEDVNNDGLCSVLDCVSTPGEKGEQGIQGLQGAQGPQGLQGLQGAQGLQGEQGPQGLQGEQGPQGEQGIQGLQGEKGLQGEQGEQGLQGLQGIQGIAGTEGLSCWDLNADGLCTDLDGAAGDEDTNSDDVCDVLDCVSLPGPEGPQGPQGIQGLQGVQGLTGAQGAQGDQGLSCWDLNGDGECTDLSGLLGDEDVNNDDNCDVLDCAGAQGIQGIQGEKGDTGDQGIQGIQGLTGAQGAQGDQGLSCWDLNGNGVCNDLDGGLGDEDVNNDDSCDVLDCAGAQGIQGEKGDTGDQGIQGIQGLTGAQGAQGDRGLSCWDLNGNGVCNDLDGGLGDEDVNGDDSCDVLDCAGPQGDQGIQGLTGGQGEKGDTGDQGIQGYSCWDLNENGSCDVGTEDTNSSGTCTVDDCSGGGGSSLSQQSWANVNPGDTTTVTGTTVVSIFAKGLSIVLKDYPGSMVFDSNTTKATQEYVDNRAAAAIDPDDNNYWTSQSAVTNMRLNWSLGEAVVVRGIYIVNAGNTQAIKNFELFGSNTDIVSDVVYSSSTDLTSLGSFLAAESATPQSFTFANATSYQYMTIKIADAYGSSDWMTLNHIQVMAEPVEYTIASPGVDYNVTKGSATGSQTLTIEWLGDNSDVVIDYQ